MTQPPQFIKPLLGRSASSASHLPLQRQASSPPAAAQVGVPAPPIVQEVLRSSGQALDPATRSTLEPRFGHDFSQVRVHTDAKAAVSAQAVNALAYTVGQEVVFGPGQFQPGTIQGSKLLTHELAHTVQQRGAAGRLPDNLVIGDSRGAAEQAAAAAARSITMGNPAVSLKADGVQISRQENPPATPAPAASTFVPEDNNQVRKYIDDALKWVPGNDPVHQRAWGHLQQLRTEKKNWHDTSMAAAERYMYARYQVASGVPAVVMTALVLAGAAAKKVLPGATPSASEAPQTPSTLAQMNWGLLGVHDGKVDYDEIQTQKQKK